MDEEEDLALMFGDEKEIAEGDQEASIIRFVNQVILQAQNSRHLFRLCLEIAPNI